MNQLLLATTTVVTLLALGLAALAIYPLFALGALLAGALVLLAYRGLRRQAARLGEALGAIWDRVHGALDQALGALRSIKILGREAEAEAEVMAGFAELGAARQAYQTGQALGQFLLQTGGAAALALLVWLALAQGHFAVATVLPLVAVFARALPLLGTLPGSLAAMAPCRFCTGRCRSADRDAARRGRGAGSVRHLRQY